MELHKQTMEQFINYLEEHGYPKDSMVTEFRVGQKYRVDLAIIDTESKLPIMIFEIKGKMRPEFIRQGKEQLFKYLNELELEKQIPAYLVFPKESEPFFEVLDVYKDRNSNSNIGIELPKLDYDKQKRARLAEKSITAEQKKIDAIDNFSKVCWWIAAILLTLGIAVKFFDVELTVVDLTIIGAVIGLILTPFANKIKFWGIEFERYRNSK